MRVVVLILILVFGCSRLLAQGTEPLEQQLENLTQQNEDNETEDDNYMQEMHQYLKDPVNLNEADEAQLESLRILTPLQAQQLLLYRKLLGPLLDIYELQAVPLWTLDLVRRIRPYVTVSMPGASLIGLIKRFRHGKHSLLIRASQVLERSKGYLLDPATVKNVYPGSPQKFLFRYKHIYKQLLQFGILGEKDAGEQFFKGRQKQGFDFYSFHLFARRIGIIKSLAIGDFTVNLGQGLIQWQSMAFKKSADVLAIKRQGEVLAPYNSPGESNFHRGVGITVAWHKWECSAFISYKKIDANLVADTVAATQYISSLQTSGYHRTNSEATDKSIQQELTFGGNILYRLKRLRVSVNVIQYRFKYPLQKAGDAYNLYAFTGKSLGNYSVDYGYTWKNIHLFGELAFNQQLNKAFVGGALVSLSASVDMSMLYRNISKSYQSLYSNAFTENSYPSNEKGLYLGIEVRPGNAWRIDAYADIYSFPWLKYRVDMPSHGMDFLVQVNFKPNKQVEIYSRYHSETKSLNSNPYALTLSPVIVQPHQNWRTQLNFAISPAVTLRSRTEMIWFDHQGQQNEQGFLQYIDLSFKPSLKPLSASVRFQYFETQGYNSRLYAFENDVLYSFSIPVFYDKGYRYYINLNYELTKRLTCWLRVAQTLYRAKNLIGTGLDEITGDKKSEVKIEVLYKF